MRYRVRRSTKHHSTWNIDSCGKLREAGWVIGAILEAIRNAGQPRPVPARGQLQSVNDLSSSLQLDVWNNDLINFIGRINRTMEIRMDASGTISRRISRGFENCSSRHSGPFFWLRRQGGKDSSHAPGGKFVGMRSLECTPRSLHGHARRAVGDTCRRREMQSAR